MFNMEQCLTILNCQGGQIDQLNFEIQNKYPNLSIADILTVFNEQNQGKLKKGDTVIWNDGRKGKITKVSLGNATMFNTKEIKEIEFFNVKLERPDLALPGTKAYQEEIKKGLTYYDIKIQEQKYKTKEYLSKIS